MDSKTVAQDAAAELTRAIERIVDDKIKRALAAVTADDLEPHTRQPVPTRIACEACSSGAVDGAKKIGRRWIAPRSAWRAWLDSIAASPPSTGDVVHLDFVRAAARRAGGRP